MDQRGKREDTPRARSKPSTAEERHRAQNEPTNQHHFERYERHQLHRALHNFFRSVNAIKTYTCGLTYV